MGEERGKEAVCRRTHATNARAFKKKPKEA